MKYQSTRNKNTVVDSAYAIAHGISVEGGLFIPESVPTLTADDFAKLRDMSYVEKAEYIFSKFLTDFTAEEISYCAKGAYLGNFDDDKPAPLYALNDNTSVLELWHGPTCAFKDLALQILPYLLTTSAKKVSNGK